MTSHSQNRSHAVMSQRFEGVDSLDDFPTPPWATRALFTHTIKDYINKRDHVCMEPACGRGFMAEVFKEYVNKTIAFDIHDYGYGSVANFLSYESKKKVDWIITNPPFKDAEEFVLKGLEISKVGVAVLVRTVFLESVGRYERLFSVTPPTLIAQFVERVPMVKGRVDRTASTATGYAWIVWLKNSPFNHPVMTWVPPCRRELEREQDYVPPNDRIKNVIPFISNSKNLLVTKREVKVKKSNKSQRDLFD